MREETLKITDKNCLDREQYGQKLKEIKVLVENKEKQKRRKQKHAEMMKRYWDTRKENDIRVVLIGSFVKNKRKFIY